MADEPTPENRGKQQAAVEFLALIDERLDQVLAQPRSWGGTDALEPLVLMLSMLRARVADPTSTDQEVIRAYLGLLARRVGKGAGDLKSRLGPQCSIDSMVAVLSEQADCIRQRGIVGLAPPTVPERQLRPAQPADQQGNRAGRRARVSR